MPCTLFVTVFGFVTNYYLYAPNVQRILQLDHGIRSYDGMKFASWGSFVHHGGANPNLWSGLRRGALAMLASMPSPMLSLHALIQIFPGRTLSLPMRSLSKQITSDCVNDSDAGEFRKKSQSCDFSARWCDRLASMPARLHTCTTVYVLKSKHQSFQDWNAQSPFQDWNAPTAVTISRSKPC